MGLKNSKAKGSKNELRCATHLEERGWLWTKSGGSLGAFDIWAIHPERETIKLVQVKSNHPPCPAERVEMLSVPLPIFAEVEIWVYIDGKPNLPRILAAVLPASSHPAPLKSLDRWYPVDLEPLLNDCCNCGRDTDDDYVRHSVVYRKKNRWLCEECGAKRG